MSAQETAVVAQPAGQGHGTVGLKRKLTGPPRLLLGKAKSKSHDENRAEARAKRLKGIRESNGNQTSLENHHAVKAMDDTIREEGCVEVLLEDSELQKPSVSVAEGQKTTVEDEEDTAESLCNSKESGGQGEEHLEAKHKNKRKPMKRGWKQSFTPSLLCFRKRRNKLDKMSAVVGKQMTDVTFSNAETRDSADSSIKAALGDLMKSRKQPNAESSNHVGDPGEKSKGKFHVGMWSSFKKLVAQANESPMSKEGGQDQGPRCVPAEIPSAKVSFRKKVESFFRHRTKKSSASFHEDLRTTQESGEEVKMVLSNRKAEVDRIVIQRDSCSDGIVDETASPSEILTVNVDVSVAKMRENEDGQTDASNTLAHISGENHQPLECQKADDKPSHDCVMEGLERLGKNVTCRSENHGNPNVADDTTASHPALTQAAPCVLAADSPSSDCVDANYSPLLGVGAYESQSPSYSERAGMLEDAMVNEKKGKDKILHVGENGPDSLSQNSNGSMSDLRSQCSEFLLLHTANSVVQTAMQAAMNQFTEELKDGSVSSENEAL